MTRINSRSSRTAARRPRLRSISAAIALASASFLASPAFAQTGDMVLDSVIAERFALWADEAVVDAAAPDPILREAAAMLDLARQFKPREVRFARSSADVLLRLGERDRALAALTALRALDPRDQLAMIQFVDLSVAGMETAEAKAAYLKQITDAVGIAVEIRSHAATLLMDLYFERSQDQQAVEAMSTALSLNPQNIVALNTRYQIAVDSGVAAERVKALAALVQASPANPFSLLAMAQECTAVGGYEMAGFYYSFGLGVIANRGQQPPLDEFLDLCAVKMLAGETSMVDSLAAQSVANLPTEPRMYAIALLSAQMGGKTEADLAPKIAEARGVYLAQLAGVSQALNTPEAKEPPATSPAVPMPNLRADVAKLIAADPDELRGAYTVALAEQIWFDAYFRAAPVDPTSLEALRTLLGAEDPVVVRLEGWSLLAAGRTDEAVVKLSAIADRDGYAKLGLIEAALAKKDDVKAKEILTELVTNRPSGFYGAFVAVEAKRQGIKVDMSPTERQIAGLAGSLKNNVENTLNNPRLAYLISARPVTISIGPGEPLLAELRILNVGSAPITIGPGGLIEPRFAVDLQTRGDAPRVFPATLVGQWTGAVRLAPQQSLVQVVRIDRGPFGAYLRQYPTPLFSINGTVTINPLYGDKGCTPAAGGQQGTIGSAMERRPSPFYVDSYRTQLVDRVSKGNVAERLSATELLAAVVPLLRQQAQTGNADAEKVSSEFAKIVEAQVAAESVPEVKAFIALASAEGSTEAAARLPIVRESLVSSDAPAVLAATLWSARSAPAAERKALADKVLAKSPQGPLKELAEALAAQADLPAAPATQPGEPATP